MKRNTRIIIHFTFIALYLIFDLMPISAGTTEQVKGSLHPKAAERPTSHADLIIFPGKEISINKERTIHGNIIIEGNGSLIVKGRLIFDPHSKIIVKQNGHLVIDGGKLTSNIGNEWLGIEVWGTTSKHQFKINGRYYQGIVEIKNGAVIENAHTAIRLCHSGDYLSTGGILLAENSDFINNGKAIEFVPYHNYKIKTLEKTNNLSKIKGCRFVTNDMQPITSPFITFISFWGVDGINIEGCSFTNLASNQVYEERGSGILSENATFKINSRLRGMDKAIPSLFTGFSVAINAQNDNEVASIIEVRGSVFHDNSIGISFSMVDSALISGNEFNIGRNMNCPGSPATGITIIASKAVCIEQNNFRHSNCSEIPDFSIGIRFVKPLCFSGSFTRKNNYYSQLHIVTQTESNSPENLKLLENYSTMENPDHSDFNLRCSDTLVLQHLFNPFGLSVKSMKDSLRVYDPTDSFSDILYSSTSATPSLRETTLMPPFYLFHLVTDFAEEVDLSIDHNVCITGLPDFRDSGNPSPSREEFAIEKCWQAKLKKLRDAVANSGRSLFQLNRRELYRLKVIAENSAGIAGVTAKNLLSFFYSLDYPDCPQLIFTEDQH